MPIRNVPKVWLVLVLNSRTITSFVPPEIRVDLDLKGPYMVLAKLRVDCPTGLGIAVNRTRQGQPFCSKVARGLTSLSTTG